MRKFYILSSDSLPTIEEEKVILAISANGGIFVKDPAKADVILIGDSIKTKNIQIISKEKKDVLQFVNGNNYIAREFFT